MRQNPMKHEPDPMRVMLIMALSLGLIATSAALVYTLVEGGGVILTGMTACAAALAVWTLYTTVKRPGPPLRPRNKKEDNQ